MKISYILSFIILASFFYFHSINLYAQQSAVAGISYSDSQKSILDSTYQRSTELNSGGSSGASVGLIDKPINPDTYLLGPNDLLTLTIVSSKSIEKDLLIGPSCDVMLPNAGSVNLKGLTLTQGIELIKKKLHTVYKSNEVYILLKDIKKFKIPVSGLVRKPSTVTATSSDRVSELIERAGGMKYDGSLRNIKLLRNDGKEEISVDLLKFYLLGDENSNPYVLGGDHIIVPSMNKSSTIQIFGEVGNPGTFEFSQNDSLSTILKFCFGLNSNAESDSVELVRYNPLKSIPEHIFFSIEYSDSNHSYINNNFLLQSGDRIFVRNKNFKNFDKYVVISGEVTHPGKYAVTEGQDRIRDIIIKSGGIKETGTLESATIIRRSQIGEEDKEMKRLMNIPQVDMSDNEKRYFNARSSEIKGIMSVNFQTLMDNPNSNDNILVMNNDSIFVPLANNFINVQGRVNNPGNVAYKPGLTYMDYINLAGGFGFRADENSTLVIKSKGRQFSAKAHNYVLEPGDYILVPSESDKTFFDYFTTALTITTQLITILGIVLTIVRL